MRVQIENPVTTAKKIFERLPNTEIRNVLPESEARLLAKVGEMLHLDEALGGLNIITWRREIEYALNHDEIKNTEERELRRALAIVENLDDVLGEKLVDSGVYDKIEAAVRSVFPDAEQVDVDVEKGDYEDIEHLEYKSGNTIIDIAVSEVYNPHKNALSIEPVRVSIISDGHEGECVRDINGPSCELIEL